MDIDARRRSPLTGVSPSANDRATQGKDRERPFDGRAGSAPEAGFSRLAGGQTGRLRPGSALPRLMLVTEAAGIEADQGMHRMAAAVRGGVGILQLRVRTAGAAELLARARALRQAFPEICLLVNDRVDVAAAADADGVQLGTGALPVTAARRLLGDEAWVGRSVHSVEEAVAAAAEGADFLIVGTIYTTASHSGMAPAGPALLTAVEAAVTLPLLAIGGIGVSNVEECIAHGAHGIAVVRAIEEAGDPERAARDLWHALRGGEQRK